MTPDQFLSTMHRQRADQMALRLALADLAKCLPRELRDEWLSTLQARIAISRKFAQGMTPDQQAGMEAMATALDALHRSLVQPSEPEKKNGG